MSIVLRRFWAYRERISVGSEGNVIKTTTTTRSLRKNPLFTTENNDELCKGFEVESKYVVFILT